MRSRAPPLIPSCALPSPSPSRTRALSHGGVEDEGLLSKVTVQIAKGKLEGMDSKEAGGMDCSFVEGSLGPDMDPGLSLATVEPAGAVRDDCGQPAVASIDWDSLIVHETMEEEGRIEVCSQEQFYVLLGLRDEDDSAEQMAREAGPRTNANGVPIVEGTDSVAIPVDDYIPEETVIMYDKNNPCMDAGTTYPCMEEFRLAMRQFAINKEFELGIEKTDRRRYRGYCKGDDCPWSIVGHRQVDNKTIMVTDLNDVHTCTSSSRRRTTTPSAKWVASKAVSILRKNPHMGPKELQTKLQDDHKCTIGYDTL